MFLSCVLRLVAIQSVWLCPFRVNAIWFFCSNRTLIIVIGFVAAVITNQAWRNSNMYYSIGVRLNYVFACEQRHAVAAHSVYIATVHCMGASIYYESNWVALCHGSWSQFTCCSIVPFFVSCRCFAFIGCFISRFSVVFSSIDRNRQFAQYAECS